MRTVQTRSAHAGRQDLWPRLARVQLAALVESEERPPRGVIIGTSGSGKSAMLQALRRSLEATTDVPAAPAAPAEADRDAVVLVDDAHLLAPPALDRLIARAEDEASAVIVSVGAGPRSGAIDRLVRALERSTPPVILGHLDGADLRHLGACDPACLDAILDSTGGIAWLVRAALALHEQSGCLGPSTHADIDEGLSDSVAHRVHRVPSEVRAYVESVCLSPTHPHDDELAERAYAEGLLLRNGRPSPLIRSAVLSAMAPERLAARWNDSMLAGPPAALASLSDLGDPRVAQPLLMHARAALESDPASAARLFRSARAAGAAEAFVGEALANRSLGALDRAQSVLESGDNGQESDEGRAADTVAAIWAERGLPEEAHASYRSPLARGRVGQLNAALSGLAVGDRSFLDREISPDPGLPTTLDVSVRMLLSGLRASFGPTPVDGLSDLVRASEVFTSADATLPTVELPAVVAALAAIGVGDLELADSALSDAIHGRQGGVAGADHLRLWSAWVALQHERPREAESRTAAALLSPRPLGPRDRLLATALRLATVRRYDDASALELEWQRARAALAHVRFDLFSLLPLTEFAVTGARVKDSAAMDGHLGDALALLARLGMPVGWSAHVHWAGIQRGILGNAPAQLAPHARELVAASAQNPLAARMAAAGKIWTSVLAGSVDANAVEAAALGLGDVGVAWDGARLAGHGAARSHDRKASSQLLACARRLHPTEDSRPAADRDPATPPSRVQASSGLSARELEVAELVLQGKTYVEIGQAIFISPRTAEHHIARIRHRLGATSRSDLIAKLRHLMADLHEADDGDAPSPTANP